jgi:hypothetical protein
MDKLLLSFLFLSMLSCASLKKQSTPTQITNVISIEKFPEDWLGKYEGKLEIYRPGSTKNSFPADVTLTIATTPDSTRWEWTTIYTSEGRAPIEKKYFLIQPDTLPADQFLLDEDNGIFINEYLFGNTFSSAYTVNDQFFTVTINKKSDNIVQELTVFSGTPNETVEIEEGIEVGKIEVQTVQKIQFKKLKD